jgi:hypothetical protein
MSAIRCPKCQLINDENARRCRRCETPLSQDTKGDVVNPKSPNFNRTARKLVIPVIAIVVLLCIYGFYRYSASASGSEVEHAGINKATAKSTPGNGDLEEMIKLNQDFLAKLDQNTPNHVGDGLNKNQTLAFDTLTSLKERLKKITDSAALKYSGEFYRLLEKYHGQVVRFNEESTRLAKVRQRFASEINNLRSDPSMSAEDKNSKQADLTRELEREFQRSSITADDAAETVKSLRNISVPGIGQQQSLLGK